MVKLFKYFTLRGFVTLEALNEILPSYAVMIDHSKSAFKILAHSLHPGRVGGCQSNNFAAHVVSGGIL